MMRYLIHLEFVFPIFFPLRFPVSPALVDCQLPLYGKHARKC